MNIRAFVIEPYMLERFAISFGLFELALTVLAIALLICSQLQRMHKMAISATTLEQWIPVFEELLETDLEPPILSLNSKVEEQLVIRFWNRVFEASLAPARNRLVAFAYKNRFDLLSKKYVRSIFVGDRILGMATLGYMGHGDAYRVIERQSKSRNPNLSIIACRAMLMIDSERAAANVLKCALVQSWARAKAFAVFQLVPPNTWAGPALAVMQSQSVSQVATMLHGLEGIALHPLRLPVRKVLLETTNTELAIACVRFLGGLKHPNDKELFISLLKHESWVVKLRAVHALKELVHVEDEPQLVTMLDDPSWWVRHRTAQLLTSAPGFKVTQMVQQQNMAPPLSFDPSQVGSNMQA